MRLFVASRITIYKVISIVKKSIDIFLLID